MRKAERHGPPTTLFEVVHRAVEVTDPTGAFGVADPLPPVEDADEPVTAHRDIELELAELKGRIDPQDEDPAVMIASRLGRGTTAARPTMCVPGSTSAA